MVEQLIFCYRDGTVFSAFSFELDALFRCLASFGLLSVFGVLGFWFECFSFVVTQ